MLKQSVFLAAFLALSPAALAQNQGEEVSEVSRFAVEAGIGADLLLPHVNTRLTYRLPVLADQIDVFLEAQPVNMVLLGASGLIAQQLGIGARYYFHTQGGFRPYATLLAGTHFNLFAQDLPGSSSAGDPGLVGSPFVYAGVGADVMWSQHWGLNMQLAGGPGGIAYLPGNIGVRPELNLKYIF